MISRRSTVAQYPLNFCVSFLSSEELEFSRIPANASWLSLLDERANLPIPTTSIE